LGPKLPSQAHLHDRCRGVRGLEVSPDFGRPGGEGQRPCREGGLLLGHRETGLVPGRPASQQGPGLLPASL